MARPKINDCTKHNIFLCPENKEVGLHKVAEMSPKRSSTSYSDAINEIIEEWEILKEKTK